MAEAGASRHSRDDTEDLFSDNDSRPDPRRYSTSTVGSRRRSQYYESQRIERRSRPPSGASQVTSKSKGKHSSYSAPEDFSNLDEVTIPPLTHTIDERPRLEEARGRNSEQQQARAARNFSQRDGVRRRTASTAQLDQNLSELTAVPPVPQPVNRPVPGEKDLGSVPQLDDSDDSGALPPFSSRRAGDRVPLPDDQGPPVSKFLTDFYTISYLIFFSILGTLARLGVQWLTFYPGAPIATPVIWANVGGSFFLGFLAEDPGLFRDGSIRAELAGKGRSPEDFGKSAKKELAARKKTIPLYVGLATGFCGSFTSFSSFTRDVFLAVSNSLPTPLNHPYASSGFIPSTTSATSRNGGYSFEALLAVIFSTVALSLGGLNVGAHVALALEGITPTIPKAFVRRFLDPFMVLLGWGCWIGALFLAIFPPDRPDGPSSRGSWSNETWRGEVLFALVFAPVGCLIRFYASLKLNGLIPAFPLGTFAVNMFGTAIEGMCYDIQHVGVGIMGQIGGGRVGCQVLQGLQDGFCGCLTTISTWVAEINGLRRKHGYVYAFSSVIGGFCLMVVIMGSVRWSVGYSAPVCNTGYPNKLHG